MSANQDPSQASSYSNITRINRKGVTKPIGNTCQKKAASYNISQASSYATNTKDLCTITTARDNQDDCQASVSQSWKVAMGTSLAGHNASSYATYTRDSLTARQAAIHCHHHCQLCQSKQEL